MHLVLTQRTYEQIQSGLLKKEWYSFFIKYSLNQISTNQYGAAFQDFSQFVDDTRSTNYLEFDKEFDGKISQLD